MQENFTRYPAVFLVIFLLPGILVQKYISVPLPLLCLISIFIALILIKSRHPKRLYLFGFLFFFLGSVNYQIWHQTHLNHPLQPLFPIQNVDAESIVVDAPGNGQLHFIVHVEKVKFQNYSFSVNRDFLFWGNKPLKGLKYGDHIKISNITVDNYSPPRNPGQFDYGAYLKNRGVLGILIPSPDVGLKFTPQVKWYHYGYRYLNNLRYRLSLRIGHLLPPQTAVFLTAILLGEREGMPKEIKEDFQNSGIAHVLAISGLHVGFVVLIIYILLSFLPISFRMQNVLTIVLLLFYMMLTGANPPVVRATLMISIYLIGRNLERKPNVYNTIFTAAAIILFFQPQQLFWVGFQFSFTAVLSIVIIYRQLKPLENFLTARLPESFIGRSIHKGVITPFLISLAAQMGTIPLVAVYFQKIPLISFFLNLIVIPLVGLIVLLGFVCVIISFFFFNLAQLLSTLLSQTINFLVQLTHFAANLPVAYIQTTRIPLLAVVLYLLVLFLIFSWKIEKFKQLRFLFSVSTVLLLLYLLAPRPLVPEIILLDVGQGESTLVRTSGGELLLFDAGPAFKNWDSGSDVIFPSLKHLQTLHLDKVFISHGHSDHLGGLFSLQNLVSIDSVYLPDLQISYFWQDSMLTALQKNNIPVRLLKVGDLVNVDEKSTAFILAPFKTDLHPENISGEHINNSSLVVLLKTDNSKVLFTGDAQADVEKRLLVWGNMLDVDVLKIGHHGSNTSSSHKFLLKTSPKIGMIPVGESNRYNHPSPFVLGKLSFLGIKYYRTDRCGAVWLQLNHDMWEELNWR